MALVGPGPHSPSAARRAVEFATVDGTVPTLVNGQQSGTDSESVERGEAVIEGVARDAGLDPGTYESEVVVDDDLETAILEMVTHYDTICVGLSERSDASRLMVGTIAERISQEATSNVSIVRGSLESDPPNGGSREENVGESATHH